MGGRPASMTKIMAKRVHTVRTMGGNTKFRALRLDHGNFGWASEGASRTTRIVDVVYNATSNELIRTKTLVKGAVLMIDATPFRSYYESHYAKALGRKKGHNFTDEEKAAVEKLDNCGPETKKKIAARNSEVAGNLNSQSFKVNSSPRSALDRASAAAPTATSWRAKSSTSTSRSSRPRSPRHKYITLHAMQSLDKRITANL